MMKKLFTLLMMAMFLATGVMADSQDDCVCVDEVCECPEDTYETRTVIRADDFFYKGEYNEMFVISRNIGYGKLDDLRVSVSIPELGMWNVRSYFDLKTDEALVKMFDFYIPMDAADGVYTMRIIVENTEMRQVQHRYFEVI